MIYNRCKAACFHRKKDFNTAASLRHRDGPSILIKSHSKCLSNIASFDQNFTYKFDQPQTEKKDKEEDVEVTQK